jgi:hypothetical protein
MLVHVCAGWIEKWQRIVLIPFVRLVVRDDGTDSEKGGTGCEGRWCRLLRMMVLLTMWYRLLVRMVLDVR